MAQVYSVKQINSYIKNMMRQDFLLNRIQVKGEISNCKYTDKNGCIFFTLKDEDSTISVVMYGSDAYKLDFRLKDGMSVVVDGRIDVYVNRGEYQLYAKTVSQSGMGELFKQYEQLKQYYEDMGYFSPEYKRTIPKYAKRIGIVTARTGAAIKDIIKNAYERNPYVELYLYSVLVQGKDAKYSIAKGLKYVDSMGYDCIIVGRGGGSIEDLWAFNEPEVIEAVFNCKTPVISAVGHETDTTIADYAADLRAPTPSAAAELAVFSYLDYEIALQAYRYTLNRYMAHVLQINRLQLKQYETVLSHASPKDLIAQRRLFLAECADRMTYLIEQKILSAKHQLALYAEELKGLSPLQKLQDGYSYVENAQGKNVNQVKNLTKGEILTVKMTDGQAKVSVEEIIYSD